MVCCPAGLMPDRPPVRSFVPCEDSMETKKLGFDSKLVHAGADHDAYGSATVPI